MQTKRTAKAVHAPFAPLHASSVALLTTFRRSGQGVGTPVGIQIVAGAE
jgi:hypothetical protein